MVWEASHGKGVPFLGVPGNSLNMEGIVFDYEVYRFPNLWQTIRRVGTSGPIMRFGDAPSFFFYNASSFEMISCFLVISCDLFCFLLKLTLPSNKLRCHYLDFPGIFPISKGLRWFGFSQESMPWWSAMTFPPSFPNAHGQSASGFHIGI